MGVATHARHGDAGVHRRPDAAVKEVGLQIDLAVSDRDDVGGNVRGNVAGLRFDNGQRRERPTPQGLTDLGGALQQSRVKIEDVTGISFAPGRTPQQQRDFAIRHGVLGEIIVNAQCVSAVVAEVLAHRTAGIRSQVLHGGGVGRARLHHNAVLHGVVLFQGLDNLGDGRTLLPDGHIDANHIAAALVQDGVQRHGGFPRLAVADNQFALAAPDGDHRVDGLQARLERLAHGLAINHARGKAFDGTVFAGKDGPLAVGWAAQGIHYTAHQGRPDRYRHDAVGALDDVAFLNLGVIAEQHCADLVFLQVQCQPCYVVR